MCGVRMCPETVAWPWGEAMAELDADALAALVLDVAELQEQQADISGAIADLRAQLEDLAADSAAGKQRIWCWPDLDAEAAAVAWTVLTEWLRDVLVVRYPDAERVLYPCWYRHPDVLDSVTALYATWLAAYRDPKATVVLAATWLERWLPAALRQIREALRPCERGSHTGVAPRAGDVAQLF